MKNFSEIGNMQTSKDSLIESFSAQAGLSKDICTKLYEETKLQYGDDCAEKFKSLLDVQINTFESKIDEFINSLEATDVKNRNAFIVDYLSKLENDSDEFVELKVILYVLFLKDKVNFRNLAAAIDVTDSLNESVYDLKENKLFESFGINPDYIKEGRVPMISGVNDGSDIQEEIRFYGDLKMILARNNRRWGLNYHLDNAYEAIKTYLDKEIKYLTNKDNIATVDQNYQEIILKELVSGELNVMYRDVNVLRPLIADLQTLVFDMMCFTMTFVKQNQRYCIYLNRKSFDEFIAAFNMLYQQIESSRRLSLFLVPYKEVDTTHPDEYEDKTNKYMNEYEDNVQNVQSIAILENVYVDTKKWDIYFQPIKVQSVVDALYIMKSCTPDFNLKLRQYINNFVTKSFEVVGKMEHLILEASKYTKNKNSQNW